MSQTDVILAVLDADLETLVAAVDVAQLPFDVTVFCSVEGGRENTLNAEFFLIHFIDNIFKL